MNQIPETQVTQIRKEVARIAECIASENVGLRHACQGEPSCAAAATVITTLQSLLAYADQLSPGMGFRTSVDIVDVGVVPSGAAGDSEWGIGYEAGKEEGYHNGYAAAAAMNMKATDGA